MVRVAPTVLLMLATTAHRGIFRFVSAEDFEPVLPNLFKTVAPDITLDRSFVPLNIQTGTDIPVTHNAGSIDSGIEEGKGNDSQTGQSGCGLINPLP